MKNHSETYLATIARSQRTQLFGLGIILFTAILSGHYAMGYAAGGTIYLLATVIRLFVNTQEN